MFNSIFEQFEVFPLVLSTSSWFLYFFLSRSLYLYVRVQYLLFHGVLILSFVFYLFIFLIYLFIYLYILFIDISFYLFIYFFNCLFVSLFLLSRPQYMYLYACIHLYIACCLMGYLFFKFGLLSIYFIYLYVYSFIFKVFG